MVALLVAFSAGGMAWIFVNALFMQQGHHPAPLFMHDIAGTSVPANTPPSIPLPPVRAVERSIDKPVEKPIEHLAVELPRETAREAAKPVIAPVQTRPASRDQIANLLASKTEAEPEPTSRVTAAQRALMKLGYVLQADGVMGGSTRQVIELYEKRRNLPITGELSMRVIRDLSAQSGITIP